MFGFLLSLLGFNASAAAKKASVASPLDVYFRAAPEGFRKLPALQQRISFDKLDVPLMNAAVFHETNLRRVKMGLQPLKYHPQAQRAAAIQTQAMTFHDFISHENRFDSRKRTLADRLKLVNASPAFAAENLATAFALEYESGTKVYERKLNGKNVYSLKPGGPPLPMRTYQRFAEKLVDAWIHSPGHRKNLLHPGAEWLGVSCLPEKREDSIRKLYCTQIFLKLN